VAFWVISRRHLYFQNSAENDIAMKFNFLLIIIFISIQGCIFSVINDHIIGNYYLFAPDDDSQLELDYHAPDDGGTYSTVIAATVFAVGFNENYIIAKQHPYSGSSDVKNLKINYFIILLKDTFNFRTKNGIIGPLSEDQYNLKRRELNIPDNLIFSKQFENLK
jgi:hypothetical protein